MAMVFFSWPFSKRILTIWSPATGVTSSTRPRPYTLCSSQSPGAKVSFLAAGAGAAVAGADEATRLRMRRYGAALGVSFQIKDDLLDIEGDAALLGKATHMDEQRGKMTYPHLLGLDRAKRVMEEQTALALDLLGTDAPFLTELTRQLLKRDH